MTWPVERKYPRVNVTLQAELRSPSENFPRRAQTADVSAGGAYFEMIHTLEPRSPIDVTLWLGDVKVRASAEVVTDDPNVGNGIRFVRMSEKDRSALQEFIERTQANCGPIERARRRGTQRNPKL
ncbi:MAG: PilZ domain-containing protein [Terriglobales bacterium]